MNIKIFYVTSLLLLITSCSKKTTSDIESNIQPQIPTKTESITETKLPPEVETILNTRIPYDKKGGIRGSSNKPPKWAILNRRKTCSSSNWEVSENTTENQNKRVIYTCVLKDGDILIHQLARNASSMVAAKIYNADKEYESFVRDSAQFSIRSTEYKYNYADKLNQTKVPPDQIQEKMKELESQIASQQNEFNEKRNQMREKIERLKEIQTNTNFISQLKILEKDNQAKVVEKFTWVINNENYPEFKQWKVSIQSPSNKELTLWNAYDYVNVNIPIIAGESVSAEGYISILSELDLNFLKVN